MKTLHFIISLIFLVIITLPITSYAITEVQPDPESFSLIQMIFLCFLGGVAHLIIKVFEERKKQSYDFNLIDYLKMYWLAAVLNLILALIVVYIGMMDSSILKITPLVALLAGYSGSSFFTNIIQSTKKKQRG